MKRSELRDRYKFFMKKNYGNILHVYNQLQFALLKAEKLKARKAMIRRGIAPTVPAENYPLHLKQINPRKPPQVPKAYLLSTGKNVGSRVQKIYRRLNTTENDFEEDLALTSDSHLTGVVDKVGREVFVRLALDKAFKTHVSTGYARIYPTSEAIAEKSHLFNYKCVSDELILTPKENLLDAERKGWFEDLNEYSLQFTISCQYVGMLIRDGWEVNPLPYREMGEHGVFLDIDQTVEDLHNMSAHLKNIYKKHEAEFKRKPVEKDR